MVLSLFLLLLVSAFAAILFFTEPSKTDKLIHSRLVSLDQRSVDDIEQNILLKDVTFSRVPWIDNFLRNNSFANSIYDLMIQANVDWTVGQFFTYTAGCIVAGALLGNIFIKPGFTGWLPGILLAIIPYFFLMRKKSMRYRKIQESLPDAIDLLSRSLRAGQAIQNAMDMVAQEIPDPLGSEFRRAVDEQSFGLPFRESMINLVSRVRLPDLQFLVTAVLVQKETGGNLPAILDKTAALIRERVRVEGQAKIRTAQGRMTGWILSALPLVMFFAMNFVSPGYADVLMETDVGNKMLFFAAVLNLMGMVVIRKIVTVKV